MVLVAIVVAAALIVVNAIYVAAEFAAVSVRQSRVRQLASDGNVFARWLLPYIQTPASLDRYIAACQIGITVSSLVLGAYAQSALAVRLAPWLESAGGLQPLTAESASAVIVLLILTAAQVIFGELIPKTLALQYPTPSALYTLPPMVLSLSLYRPFINWLNGSGLVILRLLGAPPQAHRHVHSPDEIELLIAESRDGGMLEPDEHRRLQRALRLNLRQARQLMVPRTKMAALDVQTQMQDVIAVVAASPFSRLPVYRDSLDNVIGVLHTKDLVQWLVKGRQPGVTLASLIRPITGVHESVTADRVLRHLRERRSHQALVVDESGGTSGVVTLQDVLSEFLGEVGDEFKAAEPAPESMANGQTRLPGSMAVDDAAITLGIPIETDAATVGGYVTEALGRLPTAGDVVNVDGYSFRVERVADRAIHSVIATRLVRSEEADA